MRLLVQVPVRRCVGLALLLFASVPFGLSVAGCHKAVAVQYCNAGDSGPVVGQVASITLSPTLATTGESLNYGQIGQALSATAVDCKGNNVSITRFTFATSNMALADINPSTGQVCGGTWNRNTGGGVPDYTTCTAPSPLPATYLAFVTATASGATSNAIPVYIHPVVTGVVLGPATPAGNCPSTANPAGTDPGTDCFPISTTGTPIVAPVYTGASCLSQGSVGQLVARVYANGSTAAANNITAQVGHLSFSTQGSGNIVTIDQNGVATANQPGSTIITATVSNSSTAASAGYFATCPPASIVLSIPGQPAGTSSIGVSLNNAQPLTATVLDTNGVQLNGVQLTYLSTTPQTIQATTGSVTPLYPGSATITAVCNPGTCNPSPFSQIGLYGNGKPVTSNGITINATGVSTNVVYMGSTGSQYLLPHDFSTNQNSSLIKLPYVPNSMVISQDGSSIYLGSPQGIMFVATATNSQAATNTSVPGIVLSISPDGGTVVVTDPTRQTISLYSPTSSGVTSSIGGIGTHAQWSPDSETVYITTTTGVLLTHTVFTSWQSTPLTGADSTYSDVAVNVPSVGAYFAGTATEGRSYCSSTTLSGGSTPQTASNVFFPLADENATPTDRIAATTDGKHILGATASTVPATLSDLAITLPTQTVSGTTTIQPCPLVVTPGYFRSTTSSFPLTGITATSITGVVPATNSAVSFVTYAGSSGLLPVYKPSATGPGTLSFLTLGNGATAASAPVSGVFSTDNLSFYAGTSGDNQVHIFSLTGSTPTETGVLTPALPAASGSGTAPVNLLVQHVKKSTS